MHTACVWSEITPTFLFCMNESCKKTILQGAARQLSSLHLRRRNPHNNVKACLWYFHDIFRSSSSNYHHQIWDLIFCYLITYKNATFKFPYFLEHSTTQQAWFYTSCRLCRCHLKCSRFLHIVTTILLNFYLDAACSAKKYVASTVKIDKVDEKTKNGTHTNTHANSRP